MPHRRADLRAGGTWSLRQRTKNDLLWFSAACALALARKLPRAWLRGMGRASGRLLHALLCGERRRANDNLALCFPRMDSAERAEVVRGNFIMLGENLGDTLALLDPREAPERGLGLAASAVDVLARALAQGRGVIYITAHLGPWERMAALLAASGFPITTVARESYDPRFDRLYERLRRPRGVHAIYRGRPGAPVAIVKALRKNHVVGFLIDLPGRVPTVPVELLGQASRLPVGPAKIALGTRAPVVVGTPTPSQHGGLEIAIAEIPFEDLERGPEGEAALTQRLADALGERIAALPLHWPWMHPSFDAVRHRCDAPERDDRLAVPT